MITLLEAVTTLGKVDRFIDDVFHDEIVVCEDAAWALGKIQRIINHRNLTEARTLLDLRGKVEEMAKLWRSGGYTPTNDLLAQIVAELDRGKALIKEGT